MTNTSHTGKLPLALLKELRSDFEVDCDRIFVVTYETEASKYIYNSLAMLVNFFFPNQERKAK